VAVPLVPTSPQAATRVLVAARPPRLPSLGTEAAASAACVRHVETMCVCGGGGGQLVLKLMCVAKRGLRTNCVHILDSVLHTLLGPEPNRVLNSIASRETKGIQRYDSLVSKQRTPPPTHTHTHTLSHVRGT
jgi:hypothetical protein